MIEGVCVMNRRCRCGGVAAAGLSRIGKLPTANNMTHVGCEDTYNTASMCQDILLFIYYIMLLLSYLLSYLRLLFIML